VPRASTHSTRVRRIGSLLILVAAIVNLVSALTPPLARRVGVLSGELPLAVRQTSTIVAVLAGLALFQLARGLRRGQLYAWRLAIVLLVLSVGAHVLKGLDLEEAALGAVGAGYLWVERRHFRAPTDRPSLRRGLVTIAAAWSVGVVAGVLTIWLSKDGMSITSAVAATGERLVGITTIPIPGRWGHIITPALASMTVGLAVSVGWLLVRPRVRPVETHEVPFDQALAIVEDHGDDTLAYFALRDDKTHLVWESTLFAYAVHNGVCLVSPDPIGPLEQRTDAWAAFRRLADAHGWSLAVLGAGQERLPVYDASGMEHRYIGDEAIVDVAGFSLEGGPLKGLRQAVNRVARHGYTMSFHDPASMDPTLAMALRTLMQESLRGGVERGFSMTLSRVFDKRDAGLLLAVCHGPDGAPVACCQFVPAADIDGYSLDLMRRSVGEHPNGLVDFVLVRTIEHLRARGMHGLSLNFATMRAVLAGETGDGLGQRAQRWVLDKMSDSMQIESLWKYTAKFSPAWRPRYLVYDAPENLPAIGLAMAKAESWWELPIIGRLVERDLVTPLRAVASR
jgi:lysylphosphatidylglycerol synthetase-like protein (DUF2156 family)